MDGDGDDDAKVQNINSQLDASLGLELDNLFGKILTSVKYLDIFLQPCPILHVGPLATKFKIQIRGFLQVGKATALTTLETIAVFYLVCICFSFRKVGAL